MLGRTLEKFALHMSVAQRIYLCHSVTYGRCVQRVGLVLKVSITCVGALEESIIPFRVMSMISALVSRIDPFISNW